MALKFSQETERRLRYAAELVRRGRAGEIIISGGLCPSFEGSAEVREIADELGIVGRVSCEPHAYDTVSNLRYSLALAEKKHSQSVIICASRFHAWRAEKIFRREIETPLDVSFAAYPYSGSFPSTGRFSLICDILYNSAAYFVYRFFPEEAYLALLQMRGI